MIFVRHGLAVVQPDRPTHEWPLDPEHVHAVLALRDALPRLPVVCSTMRRAIETADMFGEPTIDARLDELPRPWTDDLEGAIARYFTGEIVDGWEPQAGARARVQDAVEHHGDAIYVSHGTVLSLYLASVVPTLDAMAFWSALRNPDAWQLRGQTLKHLAVP